MVNFFKTVYNFFSGTKVTNLYQKERFVTNISEEISGYLKELCRISGDENILMVLDDSYFKNLKQVVVFTDKKIYWTIKNASMKENQNNTEIKTKGPGAVDNHSLGNVSIFSKTEKHAKLVFIVGEAIQLIVPFANIQTENSLTLSFYDYISNYCGGYKPNNAKNESIYRKISKTKETVKANIVARIFNALSLVFAAFLVVNVILEYYKFDSIANNKIICVIVVIKLLGILFGYKRSMYSNLLLFILTYNILTIPEIYGYSNNIGYLIYAGIIILLGTFDFDRIFKYCVFILSIVSIGYMIIKYFNIQQILRYLP